MENYFAAKKKLFQAGAGGSKSPGAIINLDDPYGARLAKDSPRMPPLWTYGIHSPARLRATQVRLGKSSTSMVLETPEGRIACRLPLIGRHNIYNALAAAGAALSLRIRPETIQAALDSVPPVPGRLESVSCGQPFGVYVDYAHTDDALRNVLTTLREITSGRLLLAFGCGGNRDAGKRSKMGRVAGTLADFSIITSDNPRRESPGKIAAQIEEGFREVRRAAYHAELDRRRAIDELVRNAKPGDTVLIAGKGHETYQEFEDTVVPFDDRAHAKETLERLGWRGDK
jgi:UDP-N-acetylmuramoyl-L-alanyl-D-glutamate--2,6-diaminopimelate ligase